MFTYLFTHSFIHSLVHLWILTPRQPPWESKAERPGPQPVDGGGSDAVHQRYWPSAGASRRSFQKTCAYPPVTFNSVHVEISFSCFTKNPYSFLPSFLSRRLTARPSCCCAATWWWSTWAWSLAPPSNSPSTSTSWSASECSSSVGPAGSQRTKLPTARRHHQHCVLGQWLDTCTHSHMGQTLTTHTCSSFTRSPSSETINPPLLCVAQSSPEAAWCT